ncbi:unnamed protein product [Rhizophagus irregularis]|nr:unnamed protein product [Rhizophagus irregularis]
MYNRNLGFFIIKFTKRLGTGFMRTEALHKFKCTTPSNNNNCLRTTSLPTFHETHYCTRKVTKWRVK